MVKPMLKWAGGKRQLLGRLLPLVPEAFGTYCEPFLGGGAMLLALEPARAVVCDMNAELINVYRCVRDEPEALVQELSTYENTAEFFYEIRSLDRDPGAFAALTDVQRAARTVFLNRTCYNGLYRVNSAGQFNAPFGGYKDPDVVNAAGLAAVSGYLRENDVTLLEGDYRQALEGLSAGDFCYLDPPYDATFVGYTKTGFGPTEQERLARACRELDARGVRFMLSNSATDLVRGLYAGYRIEVVKARRAINSKGSARGPVDEVVVMNY